jgi:lipopolysaccharide export system permease protein
VKILDRYIFVSVAGSFLFGVAMFLALLLALDALPDLIELITRYNVPVSTAMAIFFLQLPKTLAYAFPMSVLLGILLSFNRMSSESEMVAMRAGGMSFLRIVLPTLVFAAMVTVLTFYISDQFAPWANERAFTLRQQALKQVQVDKPLPFYHMENGQMQYSMICSRLSVRDKEMRDVAMVWWDKGKPAVFLFVPLAYWNDAEGRWMFKGGASAHVVKDGAPAVSFNPLAADSVIDTNFYALRLKASPFEIQSSQRKPEELSAEQIRQYIVLLKEHSSDERKLHTAELDLARRFAVPFASLVMALIAAPLGLRSHRTSNAVGMGISLILIFTYYFLAHFLSQFGQSGQLNPNLAAWLPNIVAGVAGCVLLWRANR